MKVDIDSKDTAVYTSPKVNDPDGDLKRFTYTVAPIIKCGCIRIKNYDDFFQILIDQQRLGINDLGKYVMKIEMETKSQF